MTKLTELGFSKGIILETIVSTYNTDAQPNAAPMGATMINSNSIALKIYTSSLTYKNLQSKRSAVINITSNPETFYKTAFKEANPDRTLPQEWFEKAQTVDAPKLSIADAHIEVTVTEIRAIDTEKTQVTCEIKHIQTATIMPKAYCRASFATIEAIIHATRVKAFLNNDNKEKKEQALKLLENIKEYREIVNRVAPNSLCTKIMTELTQRVMES
jgi:hypothetical protein